jgi:hypothetical protein
MHLCYHSIHFIFATWSITSLADFHFSFLLIFEPDPDGDELIIICDDTKRVNRMPGFLSSRPNWPTEGGGHHSLAGEGVGEANSDD